MPEILVLCSAVDVPALWLARALTGLGETVTILTVEEVAAARIQQPHRPRRRDVVRRRPAQRHPPRNGRRSTLSWNCVVEPPAIPRAPLWPWPTVTTPSRRFWPSRSGGWRRSRPAAAGSSIRPHPVGSPAGTPQRPGMAGAGRAGGPAGRGAGSPPGRWWSGRHRLQPW